MNLKSNIEEDIATAENEQNPVYAVLRGYSDSQFDAEEVMTTLGLCCLEDLYFATRSFGLPLPQISQKHAEILAERAIRLLED